MGLTSVNIQSTLITEIPHSAFSDCDHLISVNIPESVIHISSESFKGCSRLASITIPPSVTKIWANVFEGCSQLKDVCIPSSVTYIAGYAFWECSGLRNMFVCHDNPSDISLNSYAYLHKNPCVLWVPTGAKEKYLAADEWKEFKTIKEFTEANMNIG